MDSQLIRSPRQPAKAHHTSCCTTTCVCAASKAVQGPLSKQARHCSLPAACLTRLSPPHLSMMDVGDLTIPPGSTAALRRRRLVDGSAAAPCTDPPVKALVLRFQL